MLASVDLSCIFTSTLKINPMSKKGTITTTDYIEFSKVSLAANKLMKDEKSKLLGLYIVMSSNTGLRISDILNLSWEQVKEDLVMITEKKTGKKKTFKINNAVREALNKFDTVDAGHIFISQKKSVYSRQTINRLLKGVFSKEAKKSNISSHSLRKSFGRRVYENNNESEKALTYLSELFNHTSVATTRKYLGIRQEELNDIYDNL
jgi:integrase